MTHFFIILAYFSLGAVAGILSGLIGVSGGILIVPGLEMLFRFQGFSLGNTMHFAIGTSLAITILTAGRSLLAYRHSHLSWWPVYRQMFIGVIIGVLTGALWAQHLRSVTLSFIFGTFMMIIAIKMFFYKESDSEALAQLPSVPVMNLLSAVIGTVSGLIGIGGGTLIIPTLSYFKVGVRQAIMTVSMIGTLSYMMESGEIKTVVQYSTGYIYWPAWAATALGSVLFAPMGVKFSLRLSSKWLIRFFSAFLLAIALHMLQIL